MSIQNKDMYDIDNNGRVITPSKEELKTIPKNGGEKWNRLVFETSPYLLQHAANPVDWYPWSKEAFDLAKRQDKPVFLSIGYSTCHWCHVMEHESFEDSQVAALMNETFINVKVDREQRPDIDQIYMEVTQMMNNRGGWPMTVIMTPDQKPFFSGTYFPKNTRGRLIGMTQLIPKVKEMWLTNRDSLVDISQKISNTLNSNYSTSKNIDKVSHGSIEKCYQNFRNSFDRKNGGFGGQPKFPRSHDFSFLLKYYSKTKNIEALEMAEFSLNKIRNGGIYDQVGYGLHRYSVDKRWLIPHFEKMLYDQALLIHAFIDLYMATKNNKYKDIVNEIIMYLDRDMLSDSGGFYSAEDADSQGEEGKYYVWTYDEVMSLNISKEDIEIALDYFNVSKEGNFEQRKNILTRSERTLNSDDNHIFTKIESIIDKMFIVREKKVRPLRDDKILTDWNGLVISAIARAGSVFDSDSYKSIAVNGMTFIIEEMIDSSGGLYKSHRNGTSKGEGVLDDYAFTIWALIELYNLTFDTLYLKLALKLSDYQIEHFWDEENYGFFFTSDKAESLIVRTKEYFDGAVPSGNSVSAINFIKLGKILSNVDYEQIAFKTMDSYAANINRGSSAFSMMLQAVEYGYGKNFEVIVYSEDMKETKKILKEIRSIYQPNMVTIVFSDSNKEEISKLIPYVNSLPKTNSKIQIYVCQNYSCKLPTDNLEMVKTFLLE